MAKQEAGQGSLPVRVPFWEVIDRAARWYNGELMSATPQSRLSWGGGPPEWRTFLDGIAKGSQPQAFVGRNFLIDEGVGLSRSEAYYAAGGAAAHADLEAWRMAHENYLQERVFRRAPANGLPGHIDDQDDYLCPETFRGLDSNALFVAAHTSLWLLRIEELEGMETVAGAARGELKPMAEAYLTSGGRSGEPELRDFLTRWCKQAQIRPSFVAFQADLEELLESGHGWEDRLRDALGLIHFDPGQRGTAIDVLVFRYAVREVPRLRRLEVDQRPLAVPTVLDGRFSVAFCPSPRDAAYGHVVDLSGNSSEPRREVVHPTIPLKPGNLWRIGSIRTIVDTDRLPVARQLHLMALRVLSGRDDYAMTTDGNE